MQKKYLFVFILYTSLAFGSPKLDSLLIALDHTIEQQEKFVLEKQIKLKQLKGFLADKNLSGIERYQITNRLIESYTAYNLDSTLFYIHQNLQLARSLQLDSLLYKTQLQLAGKLSSSGNYKETLDILTQLPIEKFSMGLKNKYIYEMAWVYRRLGEYSPLKSHQYTYRNLYKNYSDTLLNRLSNSSDQYNYVLQMRLKDERKLMESLELNLRRLTLAIPNTRMYSQITYFIAEIYGAQGKMNLQKKYLALSAISDTKAAVKDNASLTQLAVLLFREGDVNRAHRYINAAFDDAQAYNSKLRFISISNILPIINKAYEEEVQHQKSRLLVSVIIISLLVILLMITLVYIYRQLKAISLSQYQLKDANLALQQLNEKLKKSNAELNTLSEELIETNKVKEYYIGNLLNLCSSYLDKLETYQHTTKKLLLRKQFDELLSQTKSQQIIKNEVRLFYENFDRIFLEIYPHFIEKFNELLVKGGEVYPKKEELLSTELRIFALIRLGISDSASIATLLRYSVNTIYNYRVKIKNKAAGSREDFEAMVKRIGAIIS